MATATPQEIGRFVDRADVCAMEHEPLFRALDRVRRRRELAYVVFEKVRAGVKLQ